MSDSALHALYSIVEATYGTTPATPSMSRLRNTGCTLATTKQTFVSEEMTGDRMIPNVRHGSKQVGGDINFELSHSSLDDLLEAVLGGTWATNILKAGITRRSFSMLRHYSDLQTADKPYHMFTGSELNTLNLSIPTGGIITGSFGVLGKSQALATIPPTGAVLGSANTNEPFDSFTGTLEEGGASIAICTEVSLTLENGLEPRFAIGDDEAIKQASIDRSNLSGQASFYFENGTLLEKFLNETESSLKLALTDPDANTLEIFVPALKYNGGNTDASGGGDIIIPLPFQAYYDSVVGSSFQLTRSA